MENQNKEELLFPVDKSKADSLNELSKKLEQLANTRNPEKSEAKETISDDFDVTPEELLKIEESEKDMRELLKTMGLDYDALIRMDGKSVYARAVSANPGVLEYVKSSKNPVLEAVKIAVGFKPYAEFMDKYGNEPEAIIKNIRSEFEGEKSKENKAKESEISQQEKALSRPSFSGNGSGIKQENDSKVSTFDEIFKK